MDEDKDTTIRRLRHELADLQSRLPVAWEGVRVYPQSGSEPAEFRVPAERYGIGDVARLAGLPVMSSGYTTAEDAEMGARLESIKARARVAGLDPDDVVKRAWAAAGSRGAFYAEADAIITAALMGEADAEFDRIEAQAASHDQSLATPHELERLRSDALEVSDHETAALVMRAMSRGDLEAMVRCEALVQTMRPLWAAIDAVACGGADAVTRLAEERHALACAAAMLVGVSLAPVVFKSGRKWCVRSGRLVLDHDFESEADAQAFVDAARRGVALARRILGMGSE